MKNIFCLLLSPLLLFCLLLFPLLAGVRKKALFSRASATPVLSPVLSLVLSFAFAFVSIPLLAAAKPSKSLDSIKQKEEIPAEEALPSIKKASKRKTKNPLHVRKATKTKANKQASGRERAKAKLTANKTKKEQRLTKLKKTYRNFTSLFSRTPKLEPEELMEELSTHIDKLKSFCRSSLSPDEAALQETLEQMKAFLEEKLNEDPYMDYSIKLRFGDMLDILENLLESPPFSLSTFSLVYRRHYNLTEYQSEYSEDWARTIVEAFKCLSRSSNSGNNELKIK